eukprot:5494266-Amphidinium_carterae.1
MEAQRAGCAMWKQIREEVEIVLVRCGTIRGIKQTRIDLPNGLSNAVSHVPHRHVTSRSRMTLSAQSKGA